MALKSLIEYIEEKEDEHQFSYEEFETLVCT